MNRLQISTALAALDDCGRVFVKLFRHGSLTVEIYRPNQRDQPHTRDELYVVITGPGTFVKAG